MRHTLFCPKLLPLSKAITLIQSFLPQLSSRSACNCLILYLNASFTPMKTCESHLCWLTSYSARHKRTEGNFTAGTTMATVPVSPTHSPPLLQGENQPSQRGCFGLSSRRSAANQTHKILLLKRERAGITTKSLFCCDRAGKSALGIFSAVMKRRQCKI